MDEARIKNRFEIRLKNERASLAVQNLLDKQDVEHTAFSIVNRYIRFVDTEKDKSREQWRLNPDWEYFIGTNREQLRLTTKPEEYTLERTLNWLSRQVAPTLKMALKLDEIHHTSVVEEIIEGARLSDKHKKIIQQISFPVEELIKTESIVNKRNNEC